MRWETLKAFIKDGGNPNHTVIKACRGCQAPSQSLEQVLTMDPMPLAGQFCSDSQQALEAHCLPLSWVLCHQCGLVQVVEDVDESTLFRLYNYASSTVSGW